MSQTLAQRAAFRLWSQMQDRIRTHKQKEPESGGTLWLKRWIQRLDAEGKTMAEIAEATGVSKSTVGRHLGRKWT